MQKHRRWILFFIGIFSLAFSMIIWTIVSAVNTPVQEDESFFSSYKNMDVDFNQIVASNKKFRSLYNIEFEFNLKKTGLEFKDIFKSRRELDKKNNNKEMLIVGENSIKISIKDNQNNAVKNAKIDLKITRATDHSNDIFVDNIKFNGDYYFAKVNIDKIGNWNITGVIDINGTKGYLLLKTDTPK